MVSVTETRLTRTVMFATAAGAALFAAAVNAGNADLGTAPAAPPADLSAPPPGHWEVYPSPTTCTLLAVSFSDVNNGWAVGNNGTNRGVILRYQNGTWSVYYENPIYSFEDVDMVNVNDGWLVAFDGDDWEGEIWRWNGSSWSWFQSYVGDLFCIDMIDASHGWAGNNPNLLRYNGSSWEEGGMAPDNLHDIYMDSDTDGRAVGYGFVIRRIGNTWYTEANNADWWLAGIEHGSGGNGWAVGCYSPTKKGLIIKFTGTWNIEKIFDSAYFLVDVRLNSNNKGWAVGSKNVNPPYGGFIAYYDGTTWEETPCPTEYGLSEIALIDTNNGWIVGENGVILKYVPNVAITPTSLGRVKALFR